MLTGVPVLYVQASGEKNFDWLMPIHLSSLCMCYDAPKPEARTRTPTVASL